MKSEFLTRNAPYNGDAATPLMLAPERADARRHFDGAASLVAHVCGDPNYGAENRKLVKSWLEQWTLRTERAAQALRGLFDLKGITAEPFDTCFDRVRARQHAALGQNWILGGRANARMTKASRERRRAAAAIIA